MCIRDSKYNAIGLLNTDWGDYGHVNDPRLTIPGILYGAAFGWNAEPVEFDEDVYKRQVVHPFKHKGREKLQYAPERRYHGRCGA